LSFETEKTNQRTIICVDLNAFYPSCEELRNPSLKGKAHAVIMTDQPKGSVTKGVVSSCSYEARKYGVRSAMPLSRALALCPTLELLPVDIPYYSKVSQQVMAVLEGFTDVLEVASIDEAFLDCSSRIKYPDNEAMLVQYANDIKNALKEKCELLCSVGVAPTKSAAKMASDFQKPDGLTVIVPMKLKDFLSPLAVGGVAGIGPKTESALNELSISTLAQLASADVQMLNERFGKNGLWMWKVANGTDDEPVVPRGDHVAISTETTLDAFTRDRERLKNILLELANEISNRATEHGYTYRTVGIKLVRTDFNIETRETTFELARNDKAIIESAIGILLDKFKLSDDLPAVRKIGLKLSHLFRKDGQAAEGPQGTRNSGLQKTMQDYL
jgi:DNA polymerase IV (archaeal DinB-like DNA polymerase)